MTRRPTLRSGGSRGISSAVASVLGPNEWVYVPEPEEPAQDVCDGTTQCLLSEQIACEWALVFALLSWPRDFKWYVLATTEAARHPIGSWTYSHWWGLRNLWKNFEGSLTEFREYRAWKYQQLEDHRQPIKST